MDKRTQDVLTAIEGAKSRGWEIYSGSGVRRKTTHETPENIPSRWWSSPTYTELEFVDFVTVDGKVKSAVHSVSKTPWTERQDQKISIKKALEILSAPKDES